MADLSNINVGDKIAINNTSRSFHLPRVSKEIWTVVRKTGTQLVCTVPHQTGEKRFRIKDGHMIGAESYLNFAEPATPEMIAQHEAQLDNLNRYRKAAEDLNSLIGKELHQLKLSTKQMEVLAAAWKLVREMGK